MQGVWTPGAFEQGNSRINRPNIKNGEKRSKIYYDWVIAEHTVDVTKAAYLISKIISKAKFDEEGENYKHLTTPKLFKMTMKNIFSLNTTTKLEEYIEVYEAYLGIQQKEYEQYRRDYRLRVTRKMGEEAYKEELDALRKKMGEAKFNAFIDKQRAEAGSPEAYDAKVRARVLELGQIKYTEHLKTQGPLVVTYLDRSAPPPGSKLITRLPYVAGTEIYGDDQLGLVRYDRFLSLDAKELEDDDEEGENEKETSTQRQMNAMEFSRVQGMGAHTEYGDGIIVGVTKKYVRVLLSSGDKVKVHKLATFIITRAETSAHDVRQQISKMLGDVPLSAPVEVKDTKKSKTILQKPLADPKAPAKPAVEEEDDTYAFNLRFETISDYLGIVLKNIEDRRAVNAAQTLGFKFMPAHYRLKIKGSYRMLKKVIDWMAEGGYHMDNRNSTALWRVYEHMRTKGNVAKEMFGVGTATEIRNFMRMEFKPNTDQKFCSPYPLIENKRLWICFPKMHPGNRKVMQHIRKMPGYNGEWQDIAGNEKMYLFAPNKTLVGAWFKKVEGMGITIMNREELLEELKQLRGIRERKSPNADD
jgi:hypothetical protein